MNKAKFVLVVILLVFFLGFSAYFFFRLEMLSKIDIPNPKIESDICLAEAESTIFMYVGICGVVFCVIGLTDIAVKE
jgi:uncharacterized membrane protein